VKECNGLFFFWEEFRDNGLIEFENATFLIKWVHKSNLEEQRQAPNTST
jgi:hypothetical protein